jgi:hypothetical protein
MKFQAVTDKCQVEIVGASATGIGTYAPVFLWRSLMDLPS